MSTAASQAIAVEHGHGDGHDPHLAHHFDTPEQQFASNKLGMWVFLATEILMFGGLFCAYAVYRHNHPDVFVYAHHFLDKSLGAINTVVLITSSLTMAWAVRASQLGRQRLLAICLSLTLVGGFGFMAIKAIEYRTKWEHHLGVGAANRFDPRFKGPEKLSPGTEGSASGAAAGETMISGSAAQGSGAGGSGSDHTKKPGEEQVKSAPPAKPLDLPPDPNAGTPDAAKIRPVAVAPSGLTAAAPHHRERGGHFNEHEAEAEYKKLPVLDQRRVTTFFQVYFLMTGLHGLHVVIGMGLIFWILLRAVTPATRRWLFPAGAVTIGLFLVYLGVLVGHAITLGVGVAIALLAGAVAAIQYTRSKGVAASGPVAYLFGPRYFAPVDIVGLYWHLVDLIWIFLFPLLYLIE